MDIDAPGLVRLAMLRCKRRNLTTAETGQMRLSGDASPRLDQIKKRTLDLVPPWIGDRDVPKSAFVWVLPNGQR